MFVIGGFIVRRRRKISGGKTPTTGGTSVSFAATISGFIKKLFESDNIEVMCC